MKRYLPILLILAPILIGGCAGAVIGGTAAGVAVAHDRRDAGTIINDQELAWKLTQAIYDDKHIAREAHINVSVYNGSVLLTGESPTEDMKLRANAIASAMPKIKNLYNEIIIAEPSSLLARSKDSYITARVKFALIDNSSQQRGLTSVKVVTENRVVYLMGMVSADEAELATHRARTVDGVAKVVKLFEYIK